MESQRCSPVPVAHCIYSPCVFPHHKLHSSHTPLPENKEHKIKKLIYWAISVTVSRGGGGGGGKGGTVLKVLASH